MDKPDKSKDDFKSRIESAINKFHEKDMIDIQRQHGLIKKRKHTKPEKITETDCMYWMNLQGWSVQVINSTANWNGRAWVQQGAKQGTVDCMGNMPDGVAVMVEFKALGKLQTFCIDKNYRQQRFLEDKIKTGCFGCVVDSVELLKEIYNKWKSLGQRKEREAYLLSKIPKKKRA